VKDFIKLQTTLRATKNGIENIGPTAMTLANAEGLGAHAGSVGIRLRHAKKEV
jgi:histidinol dehydrogenase